MADMREIFNDFMRLEHNPDGSVRIPLGAERATDDLRGLKDGEVVRIIYPGELVAEAIVEHQERNGHILWYGMVPNMDAIKDIHPDTLAEQRQGDAPTAGIPRD